MRNCYLLRRSLFYEFNVILSFHLCLGLPSDVSGFLVKILYAFLITPRMLHVPPTSLFLFYYLVYRRNKVNKDLKVKAKFAETPVVIKLA